MAKSKIKLFCINGLWHAATRFYNADLLCIADSVGSALRGLRDDMLVVSMLHKQRKLQELESLVQNLSGCGTFVSTNTRSSRSAEK